MSARPRGPQPSGPRAPGPREKTCCWSASSWLHLLRSWSLRSTRGGSEGPFAPLHSAGASRITGRWTRSVRRTSVNVPREVPLRGGGGSKEQAPSPTTQSEEAEIIRSANWGSGHHAPVGQSLLLSDLDDSFLPDLARIVRLNRHCSASHC